MSARSTAPVALHPAQDRSSSPQHQLQVVLRAPIGCLLPNMAPQKNNARVLSTIAPLCNNNALVLDLSDGDVDRANAEH